MDASKDKIQCLVYPPTSSHQWIPEELQERQARYLRAAPKVCQITLFRRIEGQRCLAKVAETMIRYKIYRIMNINNTITPTPKYHTFLYLIHKSHFSQSSPKTALITTDRKIFALSNAWYLHSRRSLTSLCCTLLPTTSEVQPSEY